jgi:hypothetical protein
MEKQITSVTIFKSKSLAANFWAFQQVPLAVYRLQKVPGLTFFKSMGSGGGKGFDFMPSFSTYAWLLVWESQQHADDFYFNNPYFLKYQKKCASVQTLYLKNLVSHGKWSGISPFRQGATLDDASKIVVLTRARIKLRRLWQFWSKVGRTANELYKFDELEFAIGIGELPFIQQATISVWKNFEAMKRYAYADDTHKNVIKLTQKYKWYSEELFARFVLISTENHSTSQQQPGSNSDSRRL